MNQLRHGPLNHNMRRAARDRTKQKVKNNPMHSSQVVEITKFVFYENQLTRRAKQGHDGIMRRVGSAPGPALKSRMTSVRLSS
ncbi:hypothetical protein [Bradyrhizobium sp. LA2.1]|uniref:hypothetical protein n=1 Tax=Bradyrhizobium sp. LA2.1 TaxID=3156376 RepID=UPI0033944BD9